MFHKLLFIALMVVCFSGQALAQKSIPNQDSIKYRAFEKFSQKTKFTKFLHRLIFKPPVVKKTVKPTRKNRLKKPKPYHLTEGKIVRNIHIITQDPFGYYIQDTSIVPSSFLVKTGNKLHIKTRTKIIEDQLLFKKNEPFDSLLVMESERLIRSQKYVRDLMFYTLATSNKGDSVDVYIRVYDSWSLLPAYKRTTSTINTGISDINFFGLGHHIQAERQLERPTGNHVSQLSYSVPNIGNSYIGSKIQYSFSDQNDLVKSIEFARHFHSPVVKWAGGMYLGQILTTQNFIRNDTTRYLSSKTNVQDYWAARAWQLYKGNSVEARSTNLILSGRALRTRYPGRPPDAEQENLFINDNLYFAGIGITSRKYVQDTYIFDYGKVEDIPVGRAYGLTMGIDARQTNRWYLGLKTAWGNYFPFGYLSTHLEYGTFIRSTGFQQEVFTGRINYYTNLINLGNWKIRQFVKPTLILGKNRLPSDNLTFSEGMKGFEGLIYPATHMMVLNLQTQSYAPWNFIGFRFGPYLFSTIGMLGNKSTAFTFSRVYSMVGLGILIKNDYLMFSTFQISLSYYPSIPGTGSNIFRTNAYKTNDFGFRDFEISKPGEVDYR